MDGEESKFGEHQPLKDHERDLSKDPRKSTLNSIRL